MKKLLLLAIMLLGMGGVKVYAGLVPGNEFTSVAALDGKVFAIVNKTEGKAICNQNAGENDYDLRYLPYEDAFSAASLGYLFKIEEAQGGGYLLHCLNAEGSDYKLFGWWSAYLQSHKAGTDKCYFLFNEINGETGKDKGGDGDGYTVWDIQYVDGHGFTLKNLGTSAEEPATNRYLNDPTKRANSDTPGYFTFCELVNENPIISIENPANLVEIPQTNAGGGDSKASAVTEDGVTTYTTTTGNVCVIFKMENVEVEDCDYVTMKFAEATPSGINYSFWNGNKSSTLPTGITELKYVFADDASCAIAENKIPQVTLLTLWVATSREIKVKGVYKHKVSENTYTRTYSFDKALDFTGIADLEAYVITAFNPTTATLTLSRVYQVPANTGLYLVGKDGDYEIPIIASASAIATNLLHASSGTDDLEPTDGSNTNLIFGGTGADRGFHTLSAAGVMGANKAYLQIPTADYNTAMSASAPLRFVFEDEDATGIAEVKTVEATDDAWYTLNGVKLNGQPTEKGIYILNGKKIVIK